MNSCEGQLLVITVSDCGAELVRKIRMDKDIPDPHFLTRMKQFISMKVNNHRNVRILLRNGCSYRLYWDNCPEANSPVDLVLNVVQ